jgi:hypothetical protein
MYSRTTSGGSLKDSAVVSGWRAAAAILIPALMAAGAQAAVISERYEFSRPDVEAVGAYTRVVMAGEPSDGEPGEPVLPFGCARILLPPGEEITGIRVSTGKRVVLGSGFLVEAGQRQYPLSYTGTIERIEPDYTGIDVFPAGTHDAPIVGVLRGYAIASIVLHPVEYRPPDGTLAYFESMDVEITTAPSGTSRRACEKMIRHDERTLRQVRDAVDNAAMVEEYGAVERTTVSRLLDPDLAYRYIIITTDAWDDYLGDFVTFQTSRGRKAGVFLTSWITANYTGLDEQDQIRNFIIDAYTTWDVDYVLLVGDALDANGVPHRGFYISLGEYTDYDIPSDWYYAALDGNWNTDGDDMWGELAECDPYPEVAVGRACVSTASDVENFVTKTVRFHDAPVVPDCGQALLAGEQFDDVPTYGGDYKDQIRYGCEYAGETLAGFVDGAMSVTTLYDRDTPNWTKSEIIDLMENGKYLVNHAGHANVTACLNMLTSDLPSFDNDGTVHGLNVVYSQGCYSGSFDNRTSSGTYYNDCFAERFACDDDGAVAVVMNSRYGWYAPGSTNGPSQRFDRQFFDAIFGEHIYAIGEINNDSKVDNIAYLNSSSSRWCWYELNLFGDPALELWTDEPGDLDLSYPGIVVAPNGTASFDVVVTSAEQPVEGATVCITSPSGICAAETTDAFGEAAFEVALRVFSETATLTATAHNCIPETGSVELTQLEMWSDQTSGALGDGGQSEGVSWGDYDGDGDLDLYVANDGSANRLMWNQGGGAFGEDSAGMLADTGWGLGVSWGDFDNDGDLDLYLAKYLGRNRLFRNLGSGVFEDITAPPLDDPGDSRGAPWADFDNDGDLDLYVVNEGSPNRLIRNEGGGIFVLDDASPALADAGSGVAAAWADYDGDGDQDLYLANYNSANRLFENQGDGTFVDATDGTPLGDAGSAGGVAWGDYDNDGDLDLYLSNKNSANRLFRNDGDGAFTDVTSQPLDDARWGSGAAWADVDLDGDLDLYLAVYGDSNRLFCNYSTGLFADATSPQLSESGHSTGVAWGDYDDDGDPDLYVCNANDPNKLLRNDYAGGNNWLSVRLQGVASNRTGIGARVRIVAGGVSQMREISGGSGYASQDAPVAAFGLGSAGQVDTLLVRWSGGWVNHYSNVPCNQHLVLIEDLPPDPPTNLTAVPSDVTLTLHWDAVAAADIDHYVVERDTTALFGTAQVVCSTPDTTWVDFPILDAREYSYRVRAVDQVLNQSEPSEPVSCAALQTPPQQPSGVTAVPGDLSVALSWHPVSDVDLDGYIVERDTTEAFGSSAVEFAVQDTTLLDSPLSAGRCYFYRVVSVDWTQLLSQPSDTVFCCPGNLPPATPRNARALSRPGDIQVLWAANAEPDLAGYAVYRDTLPEISLDAPLAFTTANGFVDTACAVYRLYWYCVTARDEGGMESPPSSALGCATSPGGAVFVDAANTGLENGTFRYPFNSVQEGISAAEPGNSVLVLPGTYDAAVSLRDSVEVCGLGGRERTLIVAPVTAVGVSGATRLLGLTMDRLGMTGNALTLSASDLIVQDSAFRGGSAGVLFSGGSEASFVGCEFRGNDMGISVADSSRPVLSSCVFDSSAFCHVYSTSTRGAVLGGSLAGACDFVPGPLFMVLNVGAGEVLAEYDFWGDICFGTSWYSGLVDYSPWTDEAHVESYTECPTGVEENAVPLAPALSHNFPNPFNPSTRISYDVPAPGAHVVLRVFSLSGRLVRALENRDAVPGRHSVEWDGRDDRGLQVSSGVYMYRIEIGEFTEQRRMVLLK